MMTDSICDKNIAGVEAAAGAKDKGIHVNINTFAQTKYLKKTVRTVRRTMPTVREANIVREAGDMARGLPLSRAEATHLLALCASSPVSVNPLEETLFAKLGDYVRLS